MNKILIEDFENIIKENKSLYKFEEKTVLISGINGFIPSYLTEFLLYLSEKYLKKKIKIIGIARNKEKCQNRFKRYSNNQNLKFIYQDISKELKIEEKIDFIFHAASQASPKYYLVDPVGTINANILGTLNLLEIAKKSKVDGFLFFSSSEVYGKMIENKIFLKEENTGSIDLLDIRNCYSESKRMGEVYCQSYLHQYNIPTKIVRIFHTYGPGLQKGDGRVFMDFIENVLRDENIELKSTGEAKRTFCYVGDAIDAYLKVILEGENGGVYNVCNVSQEISIKDLAEKVVEASNKKLEVKKVERKKEDVYLPSKINRNIGDISKIKKLGWNPKVNILEGFRRTIKYMEMEDN